MTDNQIAFLTTNTTGQYASVLGVLNTTINNGIVSTTIASGAIPVVVSNNTATEVYPRIIIDSLLLKHTTSEDLFIKFKDENLSRDEILQEYYDYSVIIDSYVNNNEEIWKDQYFINLKPETYFKLGLLTPSVLVNYSLSNAGTMIYLDALEVSKENAYPKVSYTIKLSLYDPYIIHTIYNKMSKIVHINDNQLKFENVQGYISHIEMLLDTPWEDSIEVKNYKTKFEDLFSNIVAQTDAMSKKSFGYDVAAAAFSADGTPTEATVQKMLSMNESIISAYIDSHFDASKVVEDKLAEIFDEAGEILSDSNSVLKSLRATTAKNANILAGFSRGATENYIDGIDFVSTDGTYTSAVSINKDNGIYIGANKSVSIFSGSAGEGGAVVDLNKDHLLLGITQGNEGTAAEFTKQYIIMAASNQLGCTNWKEQTQYSKGQLVKYNDIIYRCKTGHISANEWDIHKWEVYNDNITGTSAGLVGAKLTKDSIGFATIDNQDTINAILMNDKGVTIGSGVDVTETTNNLRNTSGSYVRVAPTGIDLGSTADLYINTNNFKLQTNSGALDENDNSIIGNTIFAIGTNLNNISSATTINSLSSSSSVSFLVNQYGAYINGTVYASAGSFTGDVIAHSFTADGNTNKFIADSTHLGFYSLSKDIYSPIMTLSGSAMTIAQDYTLDINGNLDINSTNFKIKSDAANGETCFQAGSNSGDYIKYVTSSTNNGETVPAALVIKGDITATSLHIVENGTEQEATAWINAKVTPEAIWLGVKQRTSSSYTPTGQESVTSISLTDSNISILSAGSLNIQSNGNLNIQSGGILNVTASNIVINTNAGNDQSIFKLTDGATTNPVNYINIAKNSSGSLFAQIGGWLIEEHKLSSGNTSNYVALDSGTTNVNYAMWAGKESPDDTFTGETKTIDNIIYNVVNPNARGATFRVTRDGRVYMDKLMLWDSDNNIYKEVDFSDFKQAVSLRLTCDGDSISARANFWGKFNQSTSVTASASCSASATNNPYPGIINENITIDCSPYGSLTFEGIGLNASVQLSGTWNSAANSVQYTEGEKKVIVPASGGYAAGENSVRNLDITATYNAGWTAAVGKASNWQNKTLSAGSSVTISVPSSTVGQATSFTITASSGSGGGGNTSCFIAGTPILLSNNTTKPIEKLMLGDKVMSYDMDANKLVISEVSSLIQHKHVNNIVDIYLSSGLVITVTTEHRFLTEDGWKAIEPLDKQITNTLQIGDKIKTIENNYEVLEQIIPRKDLQDSTVYNCEIEKYHTYIVNHIIVHNIKDQAP